MADDVCSITTNLCMAVVHLPSLLHTETLQLSAGEVCVLNYITYTASGIGDLHHMLVALSKIQTFVFSWTPLMYTQKHTKMQCQCLTQNRIYFS